MIKIHSDAQYSEGYHLEFVVEFKDGGRDWVDPVVRVDEGSTHIFVTNSYRGCENTYEYPKEEILRYVVRPYHEETSYVVIEDGVVV